MNIGPNTFENAIQASCIQLAQAYSVTDQIPIQEAKDKVAKFLRNIKEFSVEEKDIYDPTPHFRIAVQLALKACDGKPDKAYYELLKLRESLN